MIRWIARKTRWGCVCCGSVRRILWYRGSNPLAVQTVCFPCKLGACERCT